MSELDKATAHYQDQHKLALFPLVVEALKNLTDASASRFRYNGQLVTAISKAVTILAKVDQTK